jgi:hypothetical protein
VGRIVPQKAVVKISGFMHNLHNLDANVIYVHWIGGLIGVRVCPANDSRAFELLRTKLDLKRNRLI